MEITRPVLRYHGGKFRLAPWVLSFFPAHKVYVEPFGGGASVLLAKAPSNTEIYNDLDSRVVTLFRVLRDQTSAIELARRLELTPFARQEYEQWCYGDPRDHIDAAHQLVARSFMGMNSKGIWQRSGFDTRINPDGFVSRLNALRASPGACRAAADRLARVIIEHCDALTLATRCDRPDTLIYCDPPYITSNGTGSHVYQHDYTPDQHRTLASALKQLRAMVVLSGYPSELYEELFPDWEMHVRPTTADAGKKRTEAVWLNPACANALQRSRGGLFAELQP